MKTRPLGIVKVQLPIESTEAEPLALIYNRGRWFEHMMPVHVGLLHIMGGDVKRFFEAWLMDDTLMFGARVEDPGW